MPEGFLAKDRLHLATPDDAPDFLRLLSSEGDVVLCASHAKPKALHAAWFKNFEWNQEQSQEFDSLLESAAAHFSEQRTLADLASRVALLESLHRSDISLLHERVKAIEDHLEQGTIATSINSLARDGPQVTKPIPVTIHASGEDYIASFFDANISASGDNPQEAYRNLADILTGKLRLFLAAKKLGPEPSRQLAVLKEYIVVE